jgi:hypothetical protein
VTGACRNFANSDWPQKYTFPAESDEHRTYQIDSDIEDGRENKVAAPFELQMD